jgi:hypothetical protein
MKQFIANQIKNVPGWRTSRKIVAFAVDDYGNVRIHSKKARERLIRDGVPLKGRFDQFDNLDTTHDYEALYDVLQSVKDKNSNSAIFTSYALPCNVDFEKTLASNLYVAETLDKTYKKLEAEFPNYYSGTFDLLQEGIKQELILPQFHGREHLNVKLINLFLKEENPFILSNFKNKSLAGLPRHKEYPEISYNKAFSFWNKTELEDQKLMISEGLQNFEQVYGIKSITFTPPALELSKELFKTCEENGIISIDKARSDPMHLGNGKKVRRSNKLGIQANQQHVTIVRNCMFEPNSRSIDWVKFTMNQISAAFFWNKPAIISSHRVNYCGFIDEKNRKKGLNQLKLLLREIVKKWPDVEFIGLDKLTLNIKEDLDLKTT